MKVKIDALIPSSRLVPISLNQGVPVVVSEPRSDVAKSLHSLAKRLAVPSSVAQSRRPAGKRKR